MVPSPKSLERETAKGTEGIGGASMAFVALVVKGRGEGCFLVVAAVLTML